MNTVVAKAAPPGSTIGVVTPGSPAESRAQIQRAIRRQEEHGYRVKLAAGALERQDWHAGSPETRSRDLQDAFGIRRSTPS